MIKLFPYQALAVDNLQTGSVLCGGVGSGKSIAALAYYYIKECGGSETSLMAAPKDLYIITTARKRDSLEWEKDCAYFGLSTTQTNESRVSVVVDSWNKISDFTNLKGKFFIFDEQRVVGSGAWVKSFLKITKNNNWILLSATPGDTWLDYIPVFVANGFYKNRTDFIQKHVVYNTFTKFPKVDRYVETGRLVKLRNKILVTMKYIKPTVSHHVNIPVEYDLDLFSKVKDLRWNVYADAPVKDIGEACHLMRKVVNRDPSRILALLKLLDEHPRLIVFYNFDYELDILRALKQELDIPIAEWNGHKHEEIPNNESWIYLVNYNSGAEAWNCIQTDAIVFYSQNYSYRIMTQAAGRIDRLNTKYIDLFYYHLISNAWIDLAILKSLNQKQNFNEQSHNELGY